MSVFCPSSEFCDLENHHLGNFRELFLGHTRNNSQKFTPIKHRNFQWNVQGLCYLDPGVHYLILYSLCQNKCPELLPAHYPMAGNISVGIGEIHPFLKRLFHNIFYFFTDTGNFESDIAMWFTDPTGWATAVSSKGTQRKVNMRKMVMIIMHVFTTVGLQLFRLTAWVGWWKNYLRYWSKLEILDILIMVMYFKVTTLYKARVAITCCLSMQCGLALMTGNIVC